MFSFHWGVLCQENESSDSEINSTGALDLEDERMDKNNNNNIVDSKTNLSTNSYIIGSQIIPKFGKHQDSSKVFIRLFLIRIASITSDILISFSNNESDSIFNDESFFETCKSFKIHDWSLFK